MGTGRNLAARQVVWVAVAPCRRRLRLDAHLLCEWCVQQPLRPPLESVPSAWGELRLARQLHEPMALAKRSGGKHRSRHVLDEAQSLALRECVLEGDCFGVLVHLADLGALLRVGRAVACGPGHCRALGGLPGHGEGFPACPWQRKAASAAGGPPGSDPGAHGLFRRTLRQGSRCAEVPLRPPPPRVLGTMGVCAFVLGP